MCVHTDKACKNGHISHEILFQKFFKFWCLSLIDWCWYKELRIQRTATKEEIDFQFLSDSRTLMTSNNSPVVFKNPSIILRGYRESASCNFFGQKPQKCTKWAQFFYRADHRTIKIAQFYESMKLPDKDRKSVECGKKERSWQFAHTIAFNCINRVGMSYCFLRASSTKASTDSGRSTAVLLAGASKTEYWSDAFCTFPKSNNSIELFKWNHNQRVCGVAKRFSNAKKTSKMQPTAAVQCKKIIWNANLRHECQTFCRFRFHLQMIYVFSMLIWAQTSVQNNLKKKNKKLPNFISQTILLPHQNPISLKIWQRFFQFPYHKTILFHNKNPSLGKCAKNSVKLPHSQEKPISLKIWQFFHTQQKPKSLKTLNRNWQLHHHYLSERESTGKKALNK